MAQATGDDNKVNDEYVLISVCVNHVHQDMLIH